MSAPADSDLSQALAAGEPEALHELYLRYAPLVYTVALRQIRDVTIAEEVTQRVFVRAWNGGRPVPPDGVSLPRWLLEFTRHALDRME